MTSDREGISSPHDTLVFDKQSFVSRDLAQRMLTTLGYRRENSQKHLDAGVEFESGDAVVVEAEEAIGAIKAALGL